MKPHIAVLSTGHAQTVVLVGGRLVYWEDPLREDCVCCHGVVSALELARELSAALGLPLVEGSMPRRAFEGDTLAWYEENLPALAPELV